MNKVDRQETYRQALFEKLKENWDLRQEISAFSRYLKTHEWVLMGEIPESYPDIKKSDIARHIKKHITSSEALRKALRIVQRNLKKTKKDRSLEQFQYCGKLHAICYPLMVDEKVFGYIGL